MADFDELKNDLLLRTARGDGYAHRYPNSTKMFLGERVERPPIWVMRQGKLPNESLYRTTID